LDEHALAIAILQRVSDASGEDEQPKRLRVACPMADTGSVEGLIGAGVGGGIMNYLGGTANITGSVLAGNQAIGGHGDTAAGSGTLCAGVGAGGAILNGLGNFNSAGYGPLSVSTVTLSNCVISGNQAESDGASALGGGIANVLSATTTVTASVLTLNEASGDDGAAGLGGGAYNDATSTLALASTVVTLNVADGTPGIGGGIYTLGTFTADAKTLISLNQASTSDNNIGP
jgi:hypothetical protein